MSDVTSLFRLSTTEESVIQTFRELAPTEQEFILRLLRVRAATARHHHDNVIQISTQRFARRRRA